MTIRFSTLIAVASFVLAISAHADIVFTQDFQSIPEGTMVSDATPMGFMGYIKTDADGDSNAGNGVVSNFAGDHVLRMVDVDGNQSVQWGWNESHPHPTQSTFSIEVAIDDATESQKLTFAFDLRNEADDANHLARFELRNNLVSPLNDISDADNVTYDSVGLGSELTSGETYLLTWTFDAEADTINMWINTAQIFSDLKLNGDVGFLNIRTYKTTRANGAGGTDHGITLDNYKVQDTAVPVPEPSLIGALALAAAALLRRRA